MHNIDALSSSIVLALGETVRSTEFLVSGSTSHAYKVTSDRAVYVLRTASPNVGKTASYEVDFALRTLLWEKQLPVAKPIATNRSIDACTKVSWALDEYCEGSHPVRGNIPSCMSRQLGTLLRALHDVPITGFGQLTLTNQGLHGVASTCEAGLLMRLEAPWPVANVSLDTHPAIRVRPSLKSTLLPLQSDLLALVAGGKAAVVHSDLHEGQMLCGEHGLTALLDFNDAVASVKELDLGSYLYFHGKACLTDLLDAYANNVGERKELVRKAELASILIALHHGNRGAVLARPHRIDSCVRHLDTLSG